MKLKESIYNSINKMNYDELMLLYEQIRLLERLKSILIEEEKSIPLEKIHEMTNSSKSSWSDSIVEERMDRV